MIAIRGMWANLTKKIYILKIISLLYVLSMIENLNIIAKVPEHFYCIIPEL